MLMKIGDITSKFGISHRSLHYWEEMGIIKCTRAENNYRYYDEENQQKIRQILVLRKLRLPLKQIIMILESNNAVEIIDTLQKNLNEVDDEINALSTIRSILDSFIQKLNDNMKIDLKVNLLDDSTILEIADSLTVIRPVLKEEKTIKDLVDADKTIRKLTDRDVRIVFLPPATVAAYQYIGNDPEMHVHQVMDKFVRDKNLDSIKPDIRHYGFNAPSPDEKGRHGYEVWVTIPDDMKVPAPLIKKHFNGGLYAAHMIPFGSFEEWGLLTDWVDNNPQYEGNSGNKGYECMWGCLEEHINYINHVNLENTEPEGTQLDLLYPIKEKRKE